MSEIMRMMRVARLLGASGVALLFGCGGTAGGESRAAAGSGHADAPAEVSAPCSLVPAADVASIVGPLTKEPEEKHASFGSYCRYAFGSSNAPRYVDLIWSDPATFGGVTSDGPDSTKINESGDFIVHRRAISGLGTRAFFLNLNGLEYSLWVLDGRRAVAVQAVLGPDNLDKFKALATRQLDARR